MRVPMSGYEVAVEDGGEGLPLLLLHGFPLSSEIFAPLRPILEQAGRLVTMDLRGFGASDAPDGDYGMDDLAEDVLRVADHLELERFVLGGHSMGGYVAFRVAARDPRRLAGLLLIDTRATADSPEGVERRRQTIAAIRDGRRQEVLGTLLEALVGPSTRERQPAVVQALRATAEAIPDHVLVGCLEGMIARPDSTGLLAELDQPALVVVGSEDQVMSVGEAQALAAALPRGRLKVVSGAGHTPTLERPEVVGDAVAVFLRDLSASPAG